MKISTLIFGLLTASTLLACGGTSSGSQDSPVKDKSQVVPVGKTPEPINGIVVPPDPGAAKDATVAGVDTDGNGIRDEIDRWIATKYGDKPGALDAIRMVAKVDQKVLISNPTIRTDALAIVYEEADVGLCTWKKLDSENIESDSLFIESMARTYNTRTRLNSRKAVYALAGMISRSVDETTIVCPYQK